jgi:hypothetical protein
METRKEIISAGLFDLDEFIGFPISVVNSYFIDKGWEAFDCFNDYKHAWVNHSLNRSIVAKIEMIDNEYLGNVIVDSIWWYEGIYSETYEKSSIDIEILIKEIKAEGTPKKR